MSKHYQAAPSAKTDFSTIAEVDINDINEVIENCNALERDAVFEDDWVEA